jgi:hypothetical protein
MPEIVVGSLSLFLGWLCLDHVKRVRARYSTEHSPRSPFYGEKPLMVVPSVLGVLFVLDGLALPALAASAWRSLADWLTNLVSLEMLLILAPTAAAAALIRLAARGSRRSEREMLSGGTAMYPSQENKIGRKQPS